jgi:hypothetical protein
MTGVSSQFLATVYPMMKFWTWPTSGDLASLWADNGVPGAPLSWTYRIAVAGCVVWKSEARDSMVSKVGTEFCDRGANKDSGISSSAAKTFASTS